MKKISIVILCISSLLFSLPALAVTIDFETLPDLSPVNDFYSALGVHFQNSISLTAGFSLNEIDYPPSSGVMAIGDDNAPIRITFDNPASNIFANFTYGSKLTFTVFDDHGSLIGSYTNPAFSNLGSTEIISLGFSGVGSLIIAGEVNNSFIMDDFSFVPIPPAVILFGSGLGILALYRRKSRP